MGIGFDKNIDSFMRHVKHECRRYKMTISISPEKSIKLDSNDYDNECGGYFDDNPLGIFIAKGSHRWLEILVHEFSHFEQWRDCDPSYVGTEYKRTNAYTIMWNWLNGKEYNEKTIDECIDKTKKCELNCERRTVQNIIKYKLPIDITMYAKRANAYVHEYNYMKLTRKWSHPTNKNPSEIPAIISQMPPHLNGNYNNMSTKLIKLYDKYLGYVDV